MLAHIRLAGVAGVGQKPPDLCGVYACDKCHELIDGRRSDRNIEKLELREAILFGLLRTLVVVTHALERGEEF